MQAPFFHIGILVTDISEAIRNFSQVLNIEFNPPTVMRTLVVEDGARGYHDVKVCYSKDGPPYVELIEGSDSGYFSLAGGEGVHHVGLWVAHEENVSDSERFKMLHVEASMPHEETTGTVTKMTTPSCLHGVRLELVDTADRPGLEAWIRGAELQPRTS